MHRMKYINTAKCGLWLGLYYRHDYIPHFAVFIYFIRLYAFNLMYYILYNLVAEHVLQCYALYAITIVNAGVAFVKVCWAGKLIT